MLYSTGCELTSPHNSGKLFGELSTEQLRAMPTALTEEEKASPFAKYYYEPMAPIAPEHTMAIQAGSIDPRHGCMPEKIGRRMVNTGHMDIENGYCVLPNGVGYAAVKIEQPGRTNEKVKAFRENFAHVGDLYYKTWYPNAHLLHYVDGAVEDFGWGMLNMHFRQIEQPHYFGLDGCAIGAKDPACIAIISMSSDLIEIDRAKAEPEHSVMLLYLRQLLSRRELRARFWLGVGITERGLVFNDSPNGADRMERMRLMMRHCMREYQNENRIMERYWTDFLGKPW